MNYEIKELPNYLPKDKPVPHIWQIKRKTSIKLLEIRTQDSLDI